MRLRWESADADRLVAWLTLAFGSQTTSGTDAAFELVGGAISVRPGTGQDRLTVDDVAGEDVAPGKGFALVAVGIATVDTERYAVEAGWTVVSLSPDPILGAFAAQIADQPLLLLEPNTEGRLVASLVRFAEGPCAIYVRPVGTSLEAVREAIATRGGTTTAIADGPFGPEVALAGRPPWGPHLLIVTWADSATGTIAP